MFNAPLAQLDRALVFYIIGRGFESLTAYHLQPRSYCGYCFSETE